MTRRKGERSRRQIDREFPHQVQITVPPFGLGVTLDRMHELAADLGAGAYATRGGDRIKDGPDTIRFCFADHGDAVDFQIVFGGLLLTLVAKDRRL